MMRVMQWALVGLLVTGSLVAQSEAIQDLEQRIRTLEVQAARAAQLESTVQDLESRLRGYEEAEDDALLEAAINRIRVEDEQVVYVAARKSMALKIGGQLRLRAEYLNPASYVEPPGAGNNGPVDRDVDFVIQRTRVNFDARLTECIRAFVEIQDSRVWGEELNVLNDLGGVDLHQGYVDFERIFDTPFTVRAGRFELKLWNQRFVSPLDWHPVGRAWDGVHVFGDLGDFFLEATWTRVIELVPVSIDQDSDFAYAQATYKGWEGQQIGLAIFYLDNNADGLVINDPGQYEIGTVAFHANGGFGGFDYSIDAAYQFGDQQTRNEDVKAWGLAAVLGYTFDCSWKPRIAVEYTYGSGDDDPTDGDFETFNPLFPFGHAYQGHLDLFTWRNNHDLAFHLQATPAEDWWIGAGVHFFWLDTTDDAWYGLNNRPTRFDPTASDEYLGWELDISAKYWVNENIWIWFGYSHFFTGDYVEESGQSPDMNWVWIQLTADF